MESRQAFFALGKFGLAKKALMPLITTYPNDTELVYNARKWAGYSAWALHPVP
jgi:hypothetical protein